MTRVSNCTVTTYSVPTVMKLWMFPWMVDISTLRFEFELYGKVCVTIGDLVCKTVFQRLQP
jgi:hypothetical protein